MIAFFLSLWALVPSVNAWLDRKGAKRHYLLVNIIRGIAAVLHGALFFPTDFLFHGRHVWDLSWGELLAILVPIVVFHLTSFWILFELQLNAYRKKPWDYYDRKEKDSGWIDRFFAWAGPVAHKIAKGLALILCILAIITIYHQRS